MFRSNSIRTAVLNGLMAASLFAQETAAQETAAKAPKVPILISPSLMDAVKAITPPPALDSKKMAQCVAELFLTRRLATPAEVERANWDNKHEDIYATGMVLSPTFTKESMPAVAALWVDMDNDQSVFVSAAKKHFPQPRPYDLDANR